MIKADNLSFGLIPIINLNYQNLYGKTSNNTLSFEITAENTISTLKLGLSVEPYVMYTVSPGFSLSLGASLNPSYRLSADYNLSFSVAGISSSTNSTNFNILTNDNSFSFSIAPSLGAKIDINNELAIELKLGYEIELTKLITDNASKLMFGNSSKVNASVNNIFAKVGLRIKL